MSKPLKEPRIVVLLAAYSGLKWLPDQVDSILSQEGVEVELWLSVDRSADGTEEWVDGLCRSEPRVRSLPHGYRFGGAARNFYRLIEEVDFSGFDYVSFADQDDIWHIDKLSRASRILTDTEADGYSSNVTAFWASGKKAVIHKDQPQKEWDYLFESPGPGCTFLLTRRLALEFKNLVGRYPDEVGKVIYHDWFCYAFARGRGFSWEIDGWESMLYRQHDSNQLGANSGGKALLSRFRIFFEAFTVKQAALIAQLVGQGDTQFARQCLANGRSSLVRLAFNSYRCRRRRVHQVALFVLCLLLALKGVAPEEKGRLSQT